MYTTKRQLREDNKMITLAIKNVKKAMRMAKSNNAERYKAMIPTINYYYKLERLNEHLLKGDVLSGSEREFYYYGVTSFWEIVA